MTPSETVIFHTSGLVSSSVFPFFSNAIFRLLYNASPTSNKLFFRNLMYCAKEANLDVEINQERLAIIQF
jgi:hypothetical protein